MHITVTSTSLYWSQLEYDYIGLDTVGDVKLCADAGVHLAYAYVKLGWVRMLEILPMDKGMCVQTGLSVREGLLQNKFVKYLPS